MSLIYRSPETDIETTLHFITVDGETFFELQRPFTSEEIEKFRAPKSELGFGLKYFKLGEKSSPFRKVEE